MHRKNNLRKSILLTLLASSICVSGVWAADTNDTVKVVDGNVQENYVKSIDVAKDQAGTYYAISDEDGTTAGYLSMASGANAQVRIYGDNPLQNTTIATIHLTKEKMADKDANVVIGSGNSISAMASNKVVNATGIDLSKATVNLQDRVKVIVNSNQNTAGIDLKDGAKLNVNGTISLDINVTNAETSANTYHAYGISASGNNTSFNAANLNALNINMEPASNLRVDNTLRTADKIIGVNAADGANLNLGKLNLNISASRGSEVIGVKSTGENATVVLNDMAKPESDDSSKIVPNIKIENSESNITAAVYADNKGSVAIGDNYKFRIANGRVDNVNNNYNAGIYVGTDSTVSTKNLDVEINKELKTSKLAQGIVVKNGTLNIDGNLNLDLNGSNVKGISLENATLNSNADTEKEHNLTISNTNTADTTTQNANEHYGLYIKNDNKKVLNLSKDSFNIADSDSANQKFGIFLEKADLTLKNANIELSGGTSSSVGIQVGAESKLTLGDNSKISTNTDANITNNNINAAVRVSEGGQVVIGAKSQIEARADKETDSKTALLVDKDANSKITINGVTKITGNIIAKEGTINIDDSNSEGNSSIEGNVKAEDGIVNIKLQLPASEIRGKSEVTPNGQYNLTLEKNAEWHLSDSSKVSTLTAGKDVRINLGFNNYNSDNKGQTLEIETLKPLKDGENAGIFVMDLTEKAFLAPNQDKPQSDLLVISDATDNTKAKIELTKSSIEALAKYFKSGKTDPIHFIDATTKVKFDMEAVNSGLRKYMPEISENAVPNSPSAVNGNMWYISGLKSEATEASKGIGMNLAALYMAGLPRVELSSLYQRLGEVANYDAETGIWARISHGNLKSKAEDLNLKIDHTLVQLGYDKVQELNDGKRILGIALGVRNSKLSEEASNGSTHNYTASVYNSYVTNSDEYLDVIGTIGKVKTSYDTTDDDGAETKNTFGNLSIEVGKKFALKQNAFIMPMAQLSYTHINGNDYTTKKNINVKQNSINSLIGRLGVKAGIDTENGSHYVKAGILREFTGKYGLIATTAIDYMSIDKSAKDTWFELGFGGTVNLANERYLYYDIEKTFGSKYLNSWQLNLGLRLSF